MDQTPPRHRLGMQPSPPDAPAADGLWEHVPDDQPDEAPPLRVRHLVRELVETAIFILLVFFIVRGIVQNFKIEGTSMEPSLHTGQYILVNKLVYFHFDLTAPIRLLPGQESQPQKVIYPFHQPRRGDILVFEYPRDVSKDYIKRVIGLPGDTLEIRDGKVFVNDVPLSEPYLNGAATACPGSRVCGNGPFVIPEGKIFVMGDNRGNSSDSREWDALPLDRVVGQAWLIYYPVSSWGLVLHHDY